MKAKVAIIVRTKDREQFLRRALVDISKQTFSDYVVSIINDGGESSFIESCIPETIQSKTIVNHNPESLGMEAASNRAIGAVDSDYIVIHDDDDSWEANFLQKTVTYLEEKEHCNGVMTYSYLIYEKMINDRIQEVSKSEFHLQPEHISISRMCEQNWFPPISFLYRRSSYDTIGPYDERCEVLGDWDFNIRFLTEGSIDVIHLFLAKYHLRKVDKNTQKSSVNSVLADRRKFRVMDSFIRDKYFRLSISNPQKYGAIGLLLNLKMNSNLAREQEGNKGILNRILSFIRNAK